MVRVALSGTSSQRGLGRLAARIHFFRLSAIIFDSSLMNILCTFTPASIKLLE